MSTVGNLSRIAGGKKAVHYDLDESALRHAIQEEMDAQYRNYGPGQPRMVDDWVPLMQTLIDRAPEISESARDELWKTIVAPGSKQRNDFSHVTNVDKYIDDITNIINDLRVHYAITKDMKDTLLGLLPKHKEIVAAQVGMSADDRPQIKMPSATKSTPKKPMPMPSHFEYFESIDRGELKKIVQEELAKVLQGK